MTALRTFELMLWIGFALALKDGWRRLGPRRALLFFGPMFLYGWLLEESAIAVFRRYLYNEGFVLTLLDAPLAVAAGWCAIAYSGLTLGRRLLTGRVQIALFAALWGLSIDFALDAVAVRLGFWIWICPEGIALPYFSVPVSNFGGWFVILFCFTYFHLLGEGRRWRRWTLGLDAVVPAVPLLLLAIQVMLATEYERLFAALGWFEMVALFPLPLMLVLCAWIWRLRGRLASAGGGVDAALLIADLFHVFCLGAALYLGLEGGDWRFLAAGLVAVLPLTLTRLLRARAAVDLILTPQSERGAC